VERYFGQIGIQTYALTAKENKRLKAFFSCTKLLKCLLSSIGLDGGNSVASECVVKVTANLWSWDSNRCSDNVHFAVGIS